MKLSVVIVSYNVRHYLVQCLDSLYRALDGVDAVDEQLRIAARKGGISLDEKDVRLERFEVVRHL